MVACLSQFLTTNPTALRTPCFIHAGLPIKQIEIKLSRIEHKALTLFEERVDSGVGARNFAKERWLACGMNKRVS